MKISKKFAILLVVPIMLLSGFSGAALVSHNQASATPAVAQAAPDVSSPSLPASSAGSLTDLGATQNLFELIYTQVNPSVVNVHVVESAPRNSSFQGLPGNPFGFSQQQPTQQALGSGFVWDKQGDIVTNNHVVAGASQIDVAFSDGTSVPATVVGTDPNSDLAVINVKVDLKSAQTGHIGRLQHGQGRRNRHRYRQPLRVGRHHDPGHCQRHGPFAPGAILERILRPHLLDPRHHPDRCRYQPGQLRGSSLGHERAGDRSNRRHSVAGRRQCRHRFRHPFQHCQHGSHVSDPDWAVPAPVDRYQRNQSELRPGSGDKFGPAAEGCIGGGRRQQRSGGQGRAAGQQSAGHHQRTADPRRW